MSENMDMEAFLTQIDGQVDNWEQVKESVGGAKTEFRSVKPGKYPAKLTGEIRKGMDKNGNGWANIQFEVTGGAEEGMTDSFFLGFDPNRTTKDGVVWGDLTAMKILMAIGIDKDNITSRREAFEMLAASVAAEEAFTLESKLAKDGINVNYNPWPAQDAPEDSSSPVIGAEVQFSLKAGGPVLKGILEADNGDGTFKVKAGPRLHPKALLV
jgi:hypothetical protein